MALLPADLNSQSTQFEVEPFVEATLRWIKVKFDGKIIADSKQPL